MPLQKSFAAKILQSATKSSSVLEAGEFWHWSVKIYSLPQVRTACLWLQNHAKLNVNLLLYACWAAKQHKACLEEPAFSQASSAIAPLVAAAVEPLRNLRRSLKNYASGPDGENIEELRQQIFTLELAAEKLIQSRIVKMDLSLRQSDKNIEEIALTNLQCYAQFSGYDITRRTQAALKILSRIVGSGKED